MVVVSTVHRSRPPPSKQELTNDHRPAGRSWLTTTGLRAGVCSPRPCPNRVANKPSGRVRWPVRELECLLTSWIIPFAVGSLITVYVREDYHQQHETLCERGRYYLPRPPLPPPPISTVAIRVMPPPGCSMNSHETPAPHSQRMIHCCQLLGVLF